MNKNFIPYENKLLEKGKKGSVLAQLEQKI